MEESDSNNSSYSDESDNPSYSAKSNSDSNLDEIAIGMLLLLSIYFHYLQSWQHRGSRNISSLKGRDYVWDLLSGHLDKMYNLFHIDRYAFLRLCDILQELNLLQNEREVGVHKFMVIFLFIVSHSIRMHVAIDQF